MAVAELRCNAAGNHPAGGNGSGEGESFHGFNTDLVANAMWREPVASSDALGPGDAALWVSLASHPQAQLAQLVTGYRLLIEISPNNTSVTSPRHFVDAFLPSKET